MDDDHMAGRGIRRLSTLGRDATSLRVARRGDRAHRVQNCVQSDRASARPAPAALDSHRHTGFPLPARARDASDVRARNHAGSHELQRIELRHPHGNLGRYSSPRSSIAGWPAKGWFGSGMCSDCSPDQRRDSCHPGHAAHPLLWRRSSQRVGDVSAVRLAAGGDGAGGVCRAPASSSGAGRQRAPHATLVGPAVSRPPRLSRAHRAARNNSSALPESSIASRSGYVRFSARNPRTVAAASGERCPDERRLRPSGRKEDVAGPLNLPRADRAPAARSATRGPPQRMIQIAQRFHHPWLATPIVHVAQSLECLFTHRRIGRQRRHHEGESRLAIRDSASDRAAAAGSPAVRDLANRQLQSQRDLVWLREWQAGHRLLATPHALRATRATSPRQRRVTKRVEPCRLLARGRGALEPARSIASSAVTARRTLVRRQKPPERPRHVAKDALDVLLVGLTRQRAHGGVEERRRRDPRLEQVVPQRHPRAAARQGIGDVLDVRQQIVPAGMRPGGTDP